MGCGAAVCIVLGVLQGNDACSGSNPRGVIHFYVCGRITVAPSYLDLCWWYTA